jgi:hypothetical protein
VSRLFVPGEVGAFAGLPAPLGSLPELFRPATFAGPPGTPLTPAVPAPAAPAMGEPTALPEPFVGPLATPPAAAPPDVPPPAEPPFPWASAALDPRAKNNAKAVAGNFFKASLLPAYQANFDTAAWFLFRAPTDGHSTSRCRTV